MVVLALVFSVIALICGIIAVVKSGKVKEVVTEQKIIRAPIEHPFTYDEKNKTFVLKGNLYVDGGLACINEVKFLNKVK